MTKPYSANAQHTTHARALVHFGLEKNVSQSPFHFTLLLNVSIELKHCRYFVRCQPVVGGVWATLLSACTHKLPMFFSCVLFSLCVLLRLPCPVGSWFELISYAQLLKWLHFNSLFPCFAFVGLKCVGYELFMFYAADE